MKGGGKFLTVAQLAEACGPPWPEQHTVWIRRLRDLTNIGAVPVAGRNHEGTGRHRLYSPRIVPLAAVLLRLGDLGLQIGDILPVSELIRQPRRTEQAVKQAWHHALTLAFPDAWLAVAPMPKESGVYFESGIGPIALEHSSPDEPDAWSIVNLSSTFRKLKL